MHCLEQDRLKPPYKPELVGVRVLGEAMSAAYIRVILRRGGG